MVAILGMSEMWAREREEIATRPREGLGRPPGPEEIAQAWRELHGPEPDHPVAW
jgi:hypothetical protein